MHGEDDSQVVGWSKIPHHFQLLGYSFLESYCLLGSGSSLLGRIGRTRQEVESHSLIITFEDIYIGPTVHSFVG